MKAQECPICGVGTLKKQVGNETFQYKGETIIVPNYVTYECGECGEAIVDKVTLKESGRILKDFQRKVDGLLTGEEIKRIRKKLVRTQEEMAEILGGGTKGFAKYESGQVCQSRGMDNLLRILDVYPFALNVIKRDSKAGISLQKEDKVVYFEKYKENRYKLKSKTMSDDFAVRSEGIEHGT
ncbi:MAG: type II toxin-antitoxin system MqsA family antitoxin [Dissulfurispiraceae bacterium]